uniref:Uncharacterized protein n=1 Tax=Anguilla anguilla TaxID=7936 RepID=A0A0E9XST7_ANGAN
MGSLLASIGLVLFWGGGGEGAVFNIEPNSKGLFPLVTTININPLLVSTLLLCTSVGPHAFLSRERPVQIVQMFIEDCSESDPNNVQCYHLAEFFQTYFEIFVEYLMLNIQTCFHLNLDIVYHFTVIVMVSCGNGP